MSQQDDKLQVEGKVEKALPGGIYEVRLTEFGGGAVVVRAYVAGKMRRHSISLIEGDKVQVELTPYDLSQGRIVFRENVGGPGPAPRKRR